MHKYKPVSIMPENMRLRHERDNPHLFTRENQAEFKKWEQYWSDKK